MKCCLLSAILLCITSLVPTKVFGFVEDPYITPAFPTTATPISVHVTTGWCHAPTDDVDEAEIVALSPGQLRLIADGVVLPPAHPFCIHPPYTYRFDIGSLPVGTYSLQFFIRDDVGGSGLVGFGSVSFAVSSPAKIPAVSHWSVVLLIAVLCGWGLVFVCQGASD